VFSLPCLVLQEYCNKRTIL